MWDEWNGNDKRNVLKIWFNKAHMLTNAQNNKWDSFFGTIKCFQFEWDFEKKSREHKHKQLHMKW